MSLVQHHAAQMSNKQSAFPVTTLLRDGKRTFERIDLLKRIPSSRVSENEDLCQPMSVRHRNPGRNEAA